MNLSLRTLALDEMLQVIDMAAAEGWNPGWHDGAAFHAADPQGFLVAQADDGRVLGCISAFSYGADFGFIGLFIVAPPWRGQGIGSFLWAAGMQQLRGRVVGLDGVLAQQDYYRRKGFELAWRNARFAGVAQPSAQKLDACIVPLESVDFAQVCADDRRVFPAPREAFWRAWLAMPGARGLAWMEQGRLAGWGVIRPCREGYKIAPLLAERPGIAGALYDALGRQVPAGSPVFLDVPLPNSDVLELVHERGLKCVFETARMYRGAAPACELGRVYGITSFELG